ncbi:tyrosine-type recombinase/integrase [Catellatospora methionotrophica]|uniref:tyrosine-type recombinase/integrase n=1 Tax=Catellatospora methionotrophica TaxID=121620 RepID=UPI00340E8D00
MTSPTAGAADVEAARLLLARLGISAEQLLDQPRTMHTVPTFDDYIERVSAAVGDGTARVYRTYWNRVRDAWGSRTIDSVTALDIKELAERMKADLVIRRNARGGRTAVEHLIGALRCLYQFAIDDGLIDERANPSARVSKPRRLASTRHALHGDQLDQIRGVAEDTSNDPDLDTLLIDFHSQTASRRGGALALRPRDLDGEQCMVKLREKGETERWQPVSPSLMRRLIAHGAERDSLDPEGPLIRYLNGRVVTRRRYDSMWVRIGNHLPWVKAQGISTHWIRHTTLTWVERNFGYAVARAYAGHNERRSDGTTATYVKGQVFEVAAALAAYTGEAHPMAAGQPAQPVARHPSALGF